MKLLQLLVLLHAIQSGAALGDPTFQPTTDASYMPTYDETTAEPTTSDDGETYSPTLMLTTNEPTPVPSPVPTVDDETYSPTAEPTSSDDGETYSPTSEPTPVPSPVPTIDDETYSPTNEPTTYDAGEEITSRKSVTYPNQKSDVDMETAVYASARSQSQPAASKPNGNGGAIAAGILVPMFILAAYGFGVYRRKWADEREEITEADQEHNNRETESIAHDNDTGKLQDIELV